MRVEVMGVTYNTTSISPAHSCDNGDFLIQGESCHLCIRKMYEFDVVDMMYKLKKEKQNMSKYK